MFLSWQWLSRRVQNCCLLYFTHYLATTGRSVRKFSKLNGCNTEWLKWYTFEPMLVKQKIWLDNIRFFPFSNICQHFPAVCLQFFQNPTRLKHILAFATWVQMFTISVQQPFTFVNFQMAHLALPKPKIVILLQSKYSLCI